MNRSEGKAGSPVDAAKAAHPHVNDEWLSRHDEPVIEPDRRIVDPHHHLWNRPGMEYEAPALLADLQSGHDIRATVFVQCRSRYRDSGPEELRPIGETEYVVDAAEAVDRADPSRRACAGIVGYADMRLGAAVQPVLEAHLQAGGGRFRGIRHSAAWSDDPVIFNPELGAVEHMLRMPAFQAGVDCVGRMGLSFDAWVYHPQIPDVAALARACPDTMIVLDHAGGPLGIGRFAADTAAVYRDWRRDMAGLATCPNVVVKLGGLAMRISGHHFHQQPAPPDSQALATAWRPYVEFCIEAFGADRCMFESNFPVDKASCSYRVLWNAFKRLAAGCSEPEKTALFESTASRVYRLSV
ncbi:MAG: amidohydrolase [Burkholderiaceae bacterium]